MTESYVHRGVILIVEDDSAMREVMELILAEEIAVDVVFAANPCEAMQLAPHIQPDLLVLDYLLPGMTGIELYDTLHATAGLRHIPAIIMSASLPWHQQEVAERKLLALQKPFDLDRFLDAIRSSIVGMKSPLRE